MDLVAPGPPGVFSPPPIVNPLIVPTEHKYYLFHGQEIENEKLFFAPYGQHIKKDTTDTGSSTSAATNDGTTGTSTMRR